MIIDTRIKYVGATKLRTLKAEFLTKFCSSEELWVIQSNGNPKAVLVPYEMYMELQNKLNNKTE